KEWKLIEGSFDTTPVIPEWIVSRIKTQRNGHDQRVEVRPRHPKARRPAGREQAYAETALPENTAELAAMVPNSGRNNACNAMAYRLGRMAARGWLEQDEIKNALWRACEQNGLVGDDPVAVRRTIRSGIEAGLQNPHEDLKDREPP